MSVSTADEPTAWDMDLGRNWQPPDPPHELPHPLRMWDYMVGGKDNYQIDRDAAELAIKYVPNIVFAARAGEAFIIRAQKFIARPESASPSSCTSAATSRSSTAPAWAGSRRPPSPARAMSS